MEQVKITVALIIAIALQWTLRNVHEVFMYIDFPLIIIVYAALQKNTIRALIFGTIAGIAVDAAGNRASCAFTVKATRSTPF